MNARQQFDELTQKSLDSYRLTSKTELIEYTKLGVAALEEDEQDMELAQNIGLSIQGIINASKFYESKRELREINDTLLGYEDFNRGLTDQVVIKETFNTFKKYLKSIPNQLEKVL